MVPPLRELETYIFERLFRCLWTKSLMESANKEISGSQASFSPHNMLSPTHKASQHEDAIQRWQEALQVAHPSKKTEKKGETKGKSQH